MMKRKLFGIVAVLAMTGLSVLQFACGGGNQAQDQAPAAQAAPPAPEAAPADEAENAEPGA